MASAKWDWPAIEQSASNTSHRIVSLSPLSRQLINATYFELYNTLHWKGADYDLTDAEIDDIKAAIDALMREIEVSAMIGFVAAYVRTSIPPNALLCNGATYNRADYPDLYDVLPSGLQISGTQFNTPTIQDRVVVATGSTFAQFSSGGAATHVLTAAEMPSHSHTEGIVSTTLGAVGEIPSLVPTGGAGVTGNAGGGAAHNNMPPYVSLPYAIIAR